MSSWVRFAGGGYACCPERWGDEREAWGFNTVIAKTINVIKANNPGMLPTDLIKRFSFDLLKWRQNHLP
jgi:hypothetical protein